MAVSWFADLYLVFEVDIGNGIGIEGIPNQFDLDMTSIEANKSKINLNNVVN